MVVYEVRSSADQKYYSLYCNQFRLHQNEWIYVFHDITSRELNELRHIRDSFIELLLFVECNGMICVTQLWKTRI